MFNEVHMHYLGITLMMYIPHILYGVQIVYLSMGLPYKQWTLRICPGNVLFSFLFFFFLRSEIGWQPGMLYYLLEREKSSFRIVRAAKKCKVQGLELHFALEPWACGSGRLRDVLAGSVCRIM